MHETANWMAALAALVIVTGGAVGAMPSAGPTANAEETPMRVEYLEFVTPDVEGTCAAHEAASGLTFGEPVPELGNARTAVLPDGSMVGVRAPMHAAEEPVVRPYWRVDDVEAALAKAVESGAEVLHPAFEIPGRSTFAIYQLGGNQHGLWKPAG